MEVNISEDWVSVLLPTSWGLHSLVYLSLARHAGRHFIKMSDMNRSRTLTWDGGGEARSMPSLPGGLKFHGAPLFYASDSSSDLGRPSLCHHAAPEELRWSEVRLHIREERALAGIDPRPKIQRVVPGVGGGGEGGHCIVPANAALGTCSTPLGCTLLSTSPSCSNYALLPLFTPRSERKFRWRLFLKKITFIPQTGTAVFLGNQQRPN